MSRSNPNNSVKNPAVRWIEWNGEKGVFRYYDKESDLEDKNIEIKDVTFLYLDRVGAVTGWSEAYRSSIYSNQVRSSKSESLVVSAFNKSDGPIAEGVWNSIKDTVTAKGGKFTANIYAAMKINGVLSIVCIQFKGAALHAWSEFEKSAGKGINEKAVKFTGTTKGKKGSVTFHTPNFSLVDVSGDTNKSAIELDRQLQEYLSSTLGRSVSQSSEKPSESTDEKAGEAVRFEEKKKLSIASPNFATLLQNVVNKETTVNDITAKYDVDEKALNMLNTAANNSFDDGLEEEDGDLPF